MGIQTIGDLARFDINLNAKAFGKTGNEIYLRANGVDNSPVLAHGADDTQSSADRQHCRRI
jgi:DNA polymerase-4